MFAVTGITPSFSHPFAQTSKGFALDPLAWHAERRGKFQSPSRSVVSLNNCEHGARLILSKTLTSMQAAAATDRMSEGLHQVVLGSGISVSVGFNRNRQQKPDAHVRCQDLDFG